MAVLTALQAVRSRMLAPPVRGVEKLIRRYEAFNVAAYKAERGTRGAESEVRATRKSRLNGTKVSFFRDRSRRSFRYKTRVKRR